MRLANSARSCLVPLPKAVKSMTGTEDIFVVAQEMVDRALLLGLWSLLLGKEERG